jgi:hypothetical protein
LHKQLQEQRIAEALRLEGEQRMGVEEEIVREVTLIWDDMQEFVNKQQPGWIRGGVTSGMSKLPPPPPALMIE